MTRNEFLQELRDALQNESLNSAAIQENVNYYNGYISEEVAKGRSESEVLDELGDPWAIAKNLVDAPGSAYYQPDATETVYEDVSSRQQSSQNTYQKNVHVFGFDTWWKKLLAVLLVVMIVVVVITIVTGVISFLAPVIIPIVIVMIVIRLIGGRS